MHAQYTYTDDDTAAWSARIGANFSGRPQHGLRQWWPPTLHLYHPQPLLLHDLSTFLSLLSSDLSFCRFHAAPSKKGKNMKWSTSISMNMKRTLNLWEINRKYWTYICHCKKMQDNIIIRNSTQCQQCFQIGAEFRCLAWNLPWMSPSWSIWQLVSLHSTCTATGYLCCPLGHSLSRQLTYRRQLSCPGQLLVFTWALTVRQRLAFPVRYQAAAAAL